jgi:hypothetical protein
MGSYSLYMAFQAQDEGDLAAFELSADSMYVQRIQSGLEG